MTVNETGTTPVKLRVRARGIYSNDLSVGVRCQSADSTNTQAGNIKSQILCSIVKGQAVKERKSKREHIYIITAANAVLSFEHLEAQFGFFFFG